MATADPRVLDKKRRQQAPKSGGGNDPLAAALDDPDGTDPDDGLDPNEPGTLDDETDPDDPDDGGDDPDAWTPPTKEQWEAAQKNLKRARAQAKRLREAGNGASGQVGPNGKPATPAGDDGDEARAAELKAAQDRVEAAELRAVKSDARASLLERGADADLVELAIAKLKASDVVYDEDDEPDLEEWLDEMEEKYPRLFKKSPASTTTTNGRRQRPPSIDQGAGNGSRAPRTKSFADNVLEAAGYGNRRRR